VSEDRVGLQIDQFFREHPRPVDAADGPAKVHPHVAAVGPTQLRKSLHESGELGHSVRIVLSKWHQHSNAPHALALLRARRKRPSDRCAAENGDELASLHEWARASPAI
jgi:hypothetical protein